MRIHVVALPHTQTTHEYSWCAYTAKIVKFCDMLMSLGYEVFLYSGEENEAKCTKHTVCISKDEQKEWFGHYDWSKDVFDGWDQNAPWWKRMNYRAMQAISKEAQDGDFVGIIAGWCQKALTTIPRTVPVEWGIGYSGVMPNTFKCFESYAWRNFITAKYAPTDDVKFFDVVIPNSFVEKDFPIGAGGKDFGFFGRMIARKGIGIAVDACRRLDAKLICAGQGVATAEKGRIVTTDGTVLEGNVEHIGVLNPSQRAKFLGSLAALFVPTTYLEPFGGVAVEAMLCGTPVISTDWGAFAETVPQYSWGCSRCHTLSGFVAAGERALDTPSSARLDLASYARKYTTDRVRHEYDAWFKRLKTLEGEGWYA